MRLIVVGVAWVLGISFARHFTEIDLTVWLLYLAAVLAVTIVCRKHRLRWFAVVLVAFGFGALRQKFVPQSSNIAQYNDYNGTVTGLVLEEPVMSDDHIQLRLEAESMFVNGITVETSGLVMVKGSSSTSVAYGDRIRITGRLATPETWDTFSFADYLGRQGVFAIMRNAAIEVISSGHGSWFVSRLYNFKRAVHRQINRALPEPQAGLLAGIVLGNEAGISPELEDDFRRVGATHIIAISGFNMVVISAIVMRMAGGVFGGKKTLATVSAISIILVYSFMVGASAGIMRAALMSSLLVIGEQLKRNTFVPTSLALATLLLTLIDPNVLLDIGFQLSFCAVLGLGLFADPLSRRLRASLQRLLPDSRAHWLHNTLNEPLIVSIAAQISTLPLIVLYFGRLSLVALPVNLLIVPVQSAILILAMIAVAVSFFAPVVGTALFWVVMVFLSWSIAVIRGFAQLEFADMVLNVDGRVIQAYYVFMIGGAIMAASRPPILVQLVGLLRFRRVFLSLLCAAGIVSILLSAMFFSRSDGELHIWLLNLGHSNAVLLQTPGGTQMLVDGGRFPSRLLTAIGDRLPFYDREIEVLAFTHPDEWDISAVNSVLDRYRIGVALFNGQPNRTEVVAELSAKLSSEGVEQVAVQAGHIIEFGDGVIVEVLHPQAAPKISDRLNDHVLVLRVSYGDASFLLCSDLSLAGQALMMNNGVWPLANVLQLPNHGTWRSIDSEFLAAVQPLVALLQSDIANRRDDPDPDTLRMFEHLIEKERFFRTDEAGTIHLSSDGRVVRVAGDA